MAAKVAKPTSPRPFIFVLMPFDAKFDDVYKLAIKDAAQDVGAYAERVDEQDYAEGILDRIFNQINKADVVVADMTGRNPNVFYEVGYAHALNKLVVLVTQSADDIPFDLKHRQHIVYGGKIDDLRRALLPKLRWAVAEAAERRTSGCDEYFAVYLADQQIPSAAANSRVSVSGLAFQDHSRGLAEVIVRLALRNDSDGQTSAVRHVYLFAPRKSPVFPVTVLGLQEHFIAPLTSYSRLPVPARDADAFDGLHDLYHMKGEIPTLPPGGVEMTTIVFALKGDKPPGPVPFRLRLHTERGAHDYPFELSVAEVRMWQGKKRAGAA